MHLLQVYSLGRGKRQEARGAIINVPIIAHATMAFHHYRDIVLPWFLILFLAVLVPLPPCSCLPNTKHRRTTKKAHDRFERWTTATNHLQDDDERYSSRLLWIDGNNVRGIGKFEWNAVELQNRVVRFCHKYKIPNAVVVWDHGSHPFACSTRYCFDDNDLGGTVVNRVGTKDEDNNLFYVNLVVLFSGLGQRADDVLVRESNHLITASSSFLDGSKSSNVKMDWASLAFVTNDRDLRYKLRRQATPISPSIRLSRRKRRDSGKLYDSNDTGTTVDSSRDSPLFCDSTGFVEILHELSGEYDMELNAIDEAASESIETTRASIRDCSRSQRRGYNPRREKTWERCVQAETFRRFLDASSSSSTHVEEEEPSEHKDKNSVFIADYLQELQTARGYSMSSARGNSSGDDKSNSDAPENQFLPFRGPTRLDKHQRRLLDRFNALVKNGEIV